MSEKIDLESQNVIIDKDGNKIDCDVLFTFDSEESGKVYIGYTDHSIASNGRKNIYVSAYNPISGNEKLEDVKDPRELSMINDVLVEIDNM